MSRLPIPHFIERLFAEKADKPVIVTVTVDTNGASMSAADLAKLTSDMVMCWYTGDKTKLKTDLSILPGSGEQPTGTAISQTTFTIAFIHSANSQAIASVIKTDVTTRVSVSRTSILNTAGIAVVYKNGTTCIFYINTTISNSGSGWTKIADMPSGFEPNASYTYEALLTNNFVTQARPNGFYTYSPVAGKEIEGQVVYFRN